MFLAGGLPLRPLPPSLFPSKCPPPFTQFQVFSTQVLAFVLPTCWVRHSHHASTSPPSTRLLTRVCPPSIPPLLASGPTFSAAAVPQLCYRTQGCRGKRFCFVGVHHRQSMLLAGLHCPHRRVLAPIIVELLSLCVCVFSSHPFWTSSSLDVPAGVTQEEGHTGFLIHLPSAVRALIFVARRIQPFLSLVDREVEFCVLTN